MNTQSTSTEIGRTDLHKRRQEQSLQVQSRTRHSISGVSAFEFSRSPVIKRRLNRPTESWHEVDVPCRQRSRESETWSQPPMPIASRFPAIIRVLAYSTHINSSSIQTTILITTAQVLPRIQYSLGVDSGPKSRREHSRFHSPWFPRRMQATKYGPGAGQNMRQIH